MPQISSNPLFSGTLYNANPAPSNYSSTFGGIPGPIGIPNPAQDLGFQLPGLPQLNQAASGDVLNELQGNLSPGTQKLLQDQAAQFGVGSGMPGSGLATNRYLRDLGLTSENLINQGIGNYSKLIPTVSGTQTVNPNLQSQIASRNALVNAAPVPGQSQNFAQSLFDKYLQMMRGPAASTTGTGSSSPVGGQQPLGGGPQDSYDPFGQGGEFDYFAPLDTPIQSSTINDLGVDIPDSLNTDVMLG